MQPEDWSGGESPVPVVRAWISGCWGSEVARAQVLSLCKCLPRQQHLSVKMAGLWVDPMSVLPTQPPWGGRRERPGWTGRLRLRGLAFRSGKVLPAHPHSARWDRRAMLVAA